MSAAPAVVAPSALDGPVLSANGLVRVLDAAIGASLAPLRASDEGWSPPVASGAVCRALAALGPLEFATASGGIASLSMRAMCAPPGSVRPENGTIAIRVLGEVAGGGGYLGTARLVARTRLGATLRFTDPDDDGEFEPATFGLYYDRSERAFSEGFAGERPQRAGAYVVPAACGSLGGPPLGLALPLGAFLGLRPALGYDLDPRPERATRELAARNPYLLLLCVAVAQTRLIARTLAADRRASATPGARWRPLT
ncbi:MAG: hypothetical protein ACREM2_01235 [Vulcanimicrobiaceae bacterium]